MVEFNIARCQAPTLLVLMDTFHFFICYLKIKCLQLL